jgi:hypothetical protein
MEVELKYIPWLQYEPVKIYGHGLLSRLEGYLL